MLAIFASLLLSNNPSTIFEDGFQKPNFVCVKDVGQAGRRALEKEERATDLVLEADALREGVRLPNKLRNRPKSRKSNRNLPNNMASEISRIASTIFRWLKIFGEANRSSTWKTASTVD